MQSYEERRLDIFVGDRKLFNKNNFYKKIYMIYLVSTLEISEVQNEGSTGYK